MSAPPAGSWEDFDEIFRKQREEELEKMEELEKKNKDVRGEAKERIESGDPHAFKGNEKGTSAGNTSGCLCQVHGCRNRCTCYKRHVGCSDRCMCYDCKNPFGTRRAPGETNELLSSVGSRLSSSQEIDSRETMQIMNQNPTNLGKRNREESAWGLNPLDLPPFPPSAQPFSSSNTSHVQPTMQMNNAVRPSSTSLPDLNMPASPSSASSFTQRPLSSPSTSHFQTTMETKNVLRPSSTSFQNLNIPGFPLFPPSFAERALYSSNTRQFQTMETNNMLRPSSTGFQDPNIPDRNSQGFPLFPPSFAQRVSSSSNTRQFQPTAQIYNAARANLQVLPLQVQPNFQSPIPPSSVTRQFSLFNTSQVRPTMQINSRVRPHSTEVLPQQVQAPQWPSLSWNQGSTGCLNNTEEEEED